MYHKRRNCLVIRRENWEGLSRSLFFTIMRRRIPGAIYRSLCSEMSSSTGEGHPPPCTEVHTAGLQAPPMRAVPWQGSCSRSLQYLAPLFTTLYHEVKWRQCRQQPTQTTKRNSGQLQIKLLFPRDLNWMQQQMEIKNKQNNNNKKP